MVEKEKKQKFLDKQKNNAALSTGNTKNDFLGAILLQSEENGNTLKEILQELKIQNDNNK